MEIKIEGIDYNSHKEVYSKDKVEQELYKELVYVLDNYKYRNIGKAKVQNIIKFIFNNIR